MKESKQELLKQFNRAVALGWLPHFVESVKTHTSGAFDAADLVAIASRETNLDPKWLKKAGDNGNGFGLLQADVRSFPEWIKSGKWRDAREGILMGALVLMQKRKDTLKCIGKRVTVESSKSKTIFVFIGKRVEGAELQTVAIAAYNAGRWGHFAVSKGQPASKYTTGGDYATDVQSRAAFFRPLVNKWIADNSEAAVLQIATPALPLIETNNQSVVVTPTEQNASSNVPVVSTDSAPGEIAEKSKLKEFADKYLKHCPTDKVKNIFLVMGSRISANGAILWKLGFSGRVLVFLIAFAAIVPIVWAVVTYRPRIVGWIKDIADSVLGNE